MHRQVNLEVMEQMARYSVDRFGLINTQVEAEMVDHIGQMVLTMHKRIASERLDETSISAHASVRTPTTWWQHFKQDVFPDWLLRKFPVKYTFIEQTKSTRIEARAFYPEVSIPDHAHYVTLMVRDSNVDDNIFTSDWGPHKW